MVDDARGFLTPGASCRVSRNGEEGGARTPAIAVPGRSP
jgi:hypothetical protein